MSFLAALGLLVGLFSGGLSIYEFAKSRQRPGVVLAIIAIGLLVGAFFLGNVSSLFANKGPDVSFTPVTSSQQTVTGSSPTQAQPTPTSPPSPGTVLYQADQSWSGWSGSGGWKVSDGLLLNDGTHADSNTMPTITAPYQPGGIADYAVEIKMQVVNAMTTGFIYPCL